MSANTYVVTLELTDDQRKWLVAEAEFNELLNELDALPEGSDEQHQLNDIAASKAAALTEMGFTNEDAFKVVLSMAHALRTQETVNV